MGWPGKLPANYFGSGAALTRRCSGPCRCFLSRGSPRSAFSELILALGARRNRFGDGKEALAGEGVHARIVSNHPGCRQRQRSVVALQTSRAPFRRPSRWTEDVVPAPSASEHGRQSRRIVLGNPSRTGTGAVCFGFGGCIKFSDFWYFGLAASRSVLYPTRLETRTKESNVRASFPVYEDFVKKRNESKISCSTPRLTAGVCTTRSSTTLPCAV